MRHRFGLPGESDWPGDWRDNSFDHAPFPGFGTKPQAAAQGLESVALSFGPAAVAGHLLDGFWAAAVDLAAIGAALALGSIYTVTLAFPAQKRMGSPIPGTADGYRGPAFGGTIMSLLGAAVLTIPVILIVESTNSAADSVRIPVLLVGAAADGGVLARGGRHWAATVGAPRLPELCHIAGRSTP